MESYNIVTTFQQFILALVSLLAHPQTPERARSLFRTAACEIVGDANISDDTLPAALHRAFGVAPLYAPGIEARRAEYEKLAEAFIQMVHLESDFAPAALDIDGPDVNINARHLSDALRSHLYALHESLDWWNAATLRRFYVEHRLWADQMQWELEQTRLTHKCERIGKRVTLTPSEARYALIAGGKITGVVTDEITEGVPMAVRDGEDAWIGIVRRVSDTHGQVETVHGPYPFRFADVELVALDWPTKRAA